MTNHIEKKNNIVLQNLDRFTKHFPHIWLLATLSNDRIIVERELKNFNPKLLFVWNDNM